MRRPVGQCGYRWKCASSSQSDLDGVDHYALRVERWALEVPSPDSRPVIACYCATFLKPEMLHIYRQITALQRCKPVVIAQKREQAGRYPFEGVHIVPK